MTNLFKNSWSALMIEVSPYIFGITTHTMHREPNKKYPTLIMRSEQNIYKEVD